jgi:putative FmdB family regulatory protein
MPIYEYNCNQNKSHALLQVTRSMSENDPGYLCKECDSVMSRFFTSFAIQFKGNGFYRTDNLK